MKILVALGCSHTNGSMIDGINGSSEYNVRNGFPAMLANKFGYQLVNISKPGGSNQYIQRSAIEYITNHYNKNNEYLFLINWTSRLRCEFRYSENSSFTHKTLGDYIDLKSVPFTVGTNPNLFADKRISKMLDYTPYLIDLELESLRWATWAYALQCTFENYNIPYLMSNTCEPMPRLDINKKIVNKLNLDKYIEPFDLDFVMIQYLMNWGYEKTECWHFLSDGHQAWANRLEGYLRKLNYVE